VYAGREECVVVDEMDTAKVRLTVDVWLLIGNLVEVEIEV
jgi:hypothetical protein